MTRLTPFGVRRVAPVLALTLFSFPFSSSAAAQNPKTPVPLPPWSVRLDFGPAGQTIAAGFTAVGPTDSYGAPTGYGFLTTQTAFSVPSIEPEQLRNLPDALLVDGIESGAAMQFRVDVPADGTYQVRLVVGRAYNDAAAQNGGSAPIEELGVLLNGSAFAVGAAARQPTRKAGFDESWGSYRRFSRVVDATTAQDLVFEFQNGANPLLDTPVLGLEVVELANPVPVVLDPASNKLVAQGSAAMNAFVQSALDKINASTPDYDGAWSDLENAAPSNANERLAVAWARAWWLGWLRGDEDLGFVFENGYPRDAARLEALAAELVSLQSQLPGDARVHSLLLDVRDFRRGAHRVLARGYEHGDGSNGEFPLDDTYYTSLGAGQKYENRLLASLCTGEALLTQVDGDVVADVAGAAAFPSPFHAKSRVWIARATLGRNVYFHAQFADWNHYRLALFDALWPRVDPASSDLLFPKAHGVRTVTWFVRNYVDPLSTEPRWIQPYDGAMPPGNDFDEAWWADRIATADLPSDPAWAGAAHRMARLGWSLGNWWRERRQFSIGAFGVGEIGGGDSDDVELASGLGRLLVSRIEDAADPVRAFTLGLLDLTMRGPNATVDLDQGYYYDAGALGINDVEHASEHTSLPLSFLMPTRLGDPRYVELAMRLTRNVDQRDALGNDPPGDESWTIPYGTGYVGRTFTAWHFDAYRVKQSDDFTGTLITKALLPSFELVAYSGNETAERYLIELGRVWAEAAMSTGPTLGSTGSTKPFGIAPPGFQPSTGVIGTSNWYTVPSLSGGINYYVDGIYTMIAMAADAETDPVKRQRMFGALYSAIEFVANNIPPAGSTPNQGTDEWVAQRLAATMSRLALRMRGQLAIEVAAIYDPMVVDGLLALSEDAYTGLLAQPPASPGNGKDLTVVTNTLAHGATHWQVLWPLATDWVTYTDRATVDVPALFTTQVLAGGGALETSNRAPISWGDRSGGALRLDDVALVVTEADSALTAAGDLGMRALVYSMTSLPSTELTLFVRGGYPAGDYTLEIGVDNDGDQIIDGPVAGVPQSTPVTVRRGATAIDVPALPARTNVVCELRFVAAAPGSPGAQVDLALNPETVEVDVAAGSMTLTVHNLGTADYDPAAMGLSYNSRVFAYRNGALIGGAVLPVVPAPQGLDPSSVVVTFPLFVAVTPGDDLVIEIVEHTEFEELSTLNQRVMHTVQ